MTDAQAVRCRKRLEQFLVDLLEPVGRSERRHWGEVYVRSLLLDGERKSIEPLATRLPEGNVQAMQQFIGQSPWEWNLDERSVESYPIRTFLWQNGLCHSSRSDNH